MAHIGQVHAGIGAHEPVPGLRDYELVALAQDPHALGQDQASASLGVGRVYGDDTALSFGDDLLGYDHHVAVLQADGLKDQIGDLVPGVDFGQPLYGEHRDHGRAPMTTSARSLACAGPDMMEGATMHRVPCASTRGASSASALSTTRVAAKGAHSLATPTADAS